MVYDNLINEIGMSSKRENPEQTNAKIWNMIYYKLKMKNM